MRQVCPGAVRAQGAVARLALSGPGVREASPEGVLQVGLEGQKKGPRPGADGQANPCCKGLTAASCSQRGVQGLVKPRPQGRSPSLPWWPPHFRTSTPSPSTGPPWGPQHWPCSIGPAEGGSLFQLPSPNPRIPPAGAERPAPGTCQCCALTSGAGDTVSKLQSDRVAWTAWGWALLLKVQCC